MLFGRLGRWALERVVLAPNTTVVRLRPPSTRLVGWLLGGGDAHAHALGGFFGGAEPAGVVWRVLFPTVLVQSAHWRVFDNNRRQIRFRHPRRCRESG